MGGQGNTKSFSFSFGGNDGGSGSPFGFDFGDMFNLFGGGMKGGNQQGGFSGGNNFGGFTGSGGAKSGFASSGVVKDINSQFFDKHIKDKGLTWLLLFYTPSARGYHVLESIVEDVANSLQGAVKVSSHNFLFWMLPIISIHFASFHIYSFDYSSQKMSLFRRVK